MGKAFERLAAFLIGLFMLSHIFGCIWIFIGKSLSDITLEDDSWIKADNFSGDDVTGWDLYIASFYFTMTSITTVGYGDIKGHSLYERIVCIFLHLIGVLSYSFVSGSLTSIIFNYDKINDANKEKMQVLNRLFQENDIPSQMYYQLKSAIE